MLNKRGKLLVAAILVVSLVVLTGCKNKQKKADEQAENIVKEAYKKEGQDVNMQIDSSKGKMVLENKEEGVSIKASQEGDLEVPADWPDDVKIYPGGKLIAVVESDNGIQLTVQTNDSLSEVKFWYDKEMKDTDWQQQMNVNMGDSWISSYTKNNYQLMLNASPNEDGEGNVVILNYVKAQ